MERFSRRHDYYDRIGASVQNIINQLKTVSSSGFEEILARAVREDDNLECLYILGLDGVQISEPSVIISS